MADINPKSTTVVKPPQQQPGAVPTGAKDAGTKTGSNDTANQKNIPTKSGDNDKIKEGAPLPDKIGQTKPPAVKVGEQVKLIIDIFMSSLWTSLFVSNQFFNSNQLFEKINYHSCKLSLVAI